MLFFVRCSEFTHGDSSLKHDNVAGSCTCASQIWRGGAKSHPATANNKISTISYLCLMDKQ